MTAFRLCSLLRVNMLKYDCPSYTRIPDMTHYTEKAKIGTVLVYGSPEALVWDVEGKTDCLNCSCPRLHFSTWLLSLAVSWPVNKVSQRAAVHGSARQQEQWDRDESRPCPFPLLKARIGLQLVPLLVWLRWGHDLQRLQILQVPPVIKQSNMSRVGSLQQPIDRALVVATQYSTLFHTIYHIFHSVRLYLTKKCLNLTTTGQLKCT